MAGYTVFYDVSWYLIRSLSSRLCPEYMTDTGQIKLAIPTEKGTDYQLGIFLYDLQTMSAYQEGNMFNLGNNIMTYPSKSLKLNYMIFFNDKASMPIKEEDQQLIMGVILQYLYDNAGVNIREIHSQWDERDGTATITVLNMGIDEKTKIWTALDLPMRRALYLEVSPILLASSRQIQVNRVREADFIVEEKSKEERK